jgi:hypothetical protein
MLRIGHSTGVRRMEKRPRENPLNFLPHIEDHGRDRAEGILFG